MVIMMSMGTMMSTIMMMKPIQTSITGQITITTTLHESEDSTEVAEVSDILILTL